MTPIFINGTITLATSTTSAMPGAPSVQSLITPLRMVSLRVPVTSELRIMTSRLAGT